MKKIQLSSSFALILALLFAGCGSATSNGGGGGITRLSIATGGTGGVYYPYGGGIAKIISQHIPNVEATAEVTAASIDNREFSACQRPNVVHACSQCAINT